MKKLLLIILLFIPIIGFSQLAQPDTVITDVPDEIMKSVKVYPNPFIESLRRSRGGAGPGDHAWIGGDPGCRADPAGGHRRQ